MAILCPHRFWAACVHPAHAHVVAFYFAAVHACACRMYRKIIRNHFDEHVEYICSMLARASAKPHLAATGE